MAKRSRMNATGVLTKISISLNRKGKNKAGFLVFHIALVS